MIFSLLIQYKFVSIRWYQGKCQQIAKKDQSCDANVICLDQSDPLALTCGDHKVCQCSEGYYDRGEDCRLKSELNNGKDIGRVYDDDLMFYLCISACAISYDCFPTTNDLGVEVYSHCELGKCVKDTTSSLLVENYTYSFSRAVETFGIVQDDAEDLCANGKNISYLFTIILYI